jgi:predicted HD phosphohydrolase
LCALEPEYFEALSQDSRRSLALQGGVHSQDEVDAFLDKPFAEDAVRLRRWDDAAKTPGQATPNLGHYLQIAARCQRA